MPKHRFLTGSAGIATTFAMNYPAEVDEADDGE